MFVWTFLEYLISPDSQFFKFNHSSLAEAVYQCLKRQEFYGRENYVPVGNKIALLLFRHPRALFGHQILTST